MKDIKSLSLENLSPVLYIQKLYVIGQSNGRINIVRNGAGGDCNA